MFSFRCVSALPYYMTFEGEGDGGKGGDGTGDGGGAAGGGAGGGDGGGGGTGSTSGKKVKIELAPEVQAYVNSLLAEERRKGKTANDALIAQLETQRNRADTTEQEKVQIEQRIDQLRGEYATKEEQHKRTTETQLKAEKDARAKAEKEAEDWKNRFTSKMVDVDLIGAAVDQKAFNPHTVKAILQPQTRIVEELDQDGKPTGQFVTRVQVKKKAEDGKVQVLEMTPPEAVKFLSEQSEHGNLFISGSNGGLGGTNLGARGTGTNKDEPPKDAVEYAAWRKEQKSKGRWPSTSSR